MYAIFEDGSRQYMVEEGDVLEVDVRDAEPGNQIEFDRVLVFHTGEDARIGQPLVAGAKVLAEVVDLTSTKTHIQKFKRRKGYRRLTGHRQPFLEIEILELMLEGWERPEPEEEEEDETDETSEDVGEDEDVEDQEEDEDGGEEEDSEEEASGEEEEEESDEEEKPAQS